MRNFIDRQVDLNDRVASAVRRINAINLYMRGNGPVTPNAGSGKTETRAVPDGVLNELDMWQSDTSISINQLFDAIDMLESNMGQPPVAHPTASGKY